MKESSQVYRLGCNTKSPGYGLFTAPDCELLAGDHSAAYFLEELCKAGIICCCMNEVIVWNSQNLSKWLIKVDYAWNKVTLLLHLLLLPAGGTKIMIWQHANSISSSHHLYLSSNLCTLVTVSNSSKSTALTGLHKYILWVIPYLLAICINKLLCIIWPIQVSATTSQIKSRTRTTLLKCSTLTSSHLLARFEIVKTSLTL